MSSGPGLCAFRCRSLVWLHVWSLECMTLLAHQPSCYGKTRRLYRISEILRLLQIQVLWADDLLMIRMIPLQFTCRGLKCWKANILFRSRNTLRCYANELIAILCPLWLYHFVTTLPSLGICYEYCSIRLFRLFQAINHSPITPSWFLKSFLMVEQYRLQPQCRFYSKAVSLLPLKRRFHCWHMQNPVHDSTPTTLTYRIPPYCHEKSTEDKF